MVGLSRRGFLASVVAGYAAAYLPRDSRQAHALLSADDDARVDVWLIDENGWPVGQSVAAKIGDTHTTFRAVPAGHRIRSIEVSSDWMAEMGCSAAKSNLPREQWFTTKGGDVNVCWPETKGILDIKWA